MQEHNHDKIKFDEKLLSLICHFSIFLGGIILPIIIYFINKEKSKFIKFHSLQAILFQFVYIILILILLGIYIFVTVFYYINFEQQGHKSALYPIFSIIFALTIVILISSFIGYAIYIGIKSYQGETKKYLLLGNYVYNKVSILTKN